MASEKQQKPKKSRTTVPVASRAADRKATSKSKTSPAGTGRNRLDLVGFGVLVLVALLILAVIAVPLRNYYQGRTEIIRLDESIMAKQDEKERLLTEIDKYKSDAYIEQEARRRLGVVEEGEVAFRILDPEITSGDSVTTDEQAEAESRNWHEVLWDSIAEAPDPEATNYSPGEQTPAEETPAGGAPADGTSTDGATEGDDSNGGSPAGDGNQEGDAPVGNVVEEEPDAPDPVGEMPPGEVPSGQ